MIVKFVGMLLVLTHICHAGELTAFEQELRGRSHFSIKSVNIYPDEVLDQKDPVSLIKKIVMIVMIVNDEADEDDIIILDQFYAHHPQLEYRISLNPRNREISWRGLQAEGVHANSICLHQKPGIHNGSITCEMMNTLKRLRGTAI